MSEASHLSGWGGSRVAATRRGADYTSCTPVVSSTAGGAHCTANGSGVNSSGPSPVPPATYDRPPTGPGFSLCPAGGRWGGGKPCSLLRGHVLFPPQIFAHDLTGITKAGD